MMNATKRLVLSVVEEIEDAARALGHEDGASLSEQQSWGAATRAAEKLAKAKAKLNKILDESLKP